MFDLIYEVKSQAAEPSVLCGEIYIGICDWCGNVTIGTQLNY